MTKNISLEELVLGACRQVDGLVEPPAYGAYEVLLPDEVAARWGISPHQRLAFAPEVENATYIHFGHAMVENIIDEVRAKTANGHFFINNVRPEKPKLYDVIEKAISLPNAKMFSIPGAVEKNTLHHYVRLNFKVSLVADEKREMILPVWMELQAGYSVNGAEIEKAAILDTDNDFLNLAPAALSWSGDAPLSTKTFRALLELARPAATFELGDTLAALQKRLQRFLELDRARLNDYYDELRKDTGRRLQNAEEERRPALEAKLAAIENERQSKLADVEQKYRLRIQLELINLAVIGQPKLDLTVEIRKRGTTVKRRATWDPLLHVVEPLACDVCGRPGYSLFLCENGHLAHTECLTPQCVDCKRTFCQKCAAEIQTCVVCDRPVCVHSINRCKECGRATCQAHAQECHANSAQPRRVLENLAVSQEVPSNTKAIESAKSISPGTVKSVKLKAPVKRETTKTKTSTAKTLGKPRPEVSGDFLEVYSDPAENTIVAYVIAKKRQIATREWKMSNEGIAVNCWCEKTRCPERGIIYRPVDADQITEQVNGFITGFAGEYGVPIKKIHFFHIRQGQPVGELRLKVPASWRDQETLEKAWNGFTALRLRNRNQV